MQIFVKEVLIQFKKKKTFIGRLPLMEHYSTTKDYCRYTVNLPKGQMSNDVIEVKSDEQNEEYLEVTCGDKNALLYITRLCRGSKGLFLFRCSPKVLKFLGF